MIKVNDWVLAGANCTSGNELTEDEGAVALVKVILCFSHNLLGQLFKRRLASVQQNLVLRYFQFAERYFSM